MLPDMKQSPKECARCDHNGVRAERGSNVGRDAGRARIAIRQNFGNRCLFYMEVSGALEDRFHPELIRLLVALNARRSHTGPFRPVQEPELDARRIGINSHGATQSIDLSDNMSFRQPTDGWVA